MFSFSFQTLDYSALLRLPSQDALMQAMNANFAMDMARYFAGQDLTIGTPEVLVNPSLTTTLTQVWFINTDSNARQGPFVYDRLDLTAHFADKPKLVTAAQSADATALAAWFLSAHGLYFDPADLTLTPTTPVSEDATITSGVDVTVAAINYLWVGRLSLLIVPDNHLGLKAVPGSATGMQPADVGVA